MTESRPKRWAKAIEDAQEAVARIIEVGDEYAEWRENLPENLEESPVAEKLDGVIDMVNEIESASVTLDEAFELDLPRGFGRD